MSCSFPRSPHAVHTAGIHLSGVGINDGENQGGQGLGLNFVLCINFCIFPVKPVTLKVKLQLSDYKLEEFI